MPLSVARELKPGLRLRARHLAGRLVVASLVLSGFRVGKRASRFGNGLLVLHNARLFLYDRLRDSRNVLVEGQLARCETLEQSRGIANFLERAVVAARCGSEKVF